MDREILFRGKDIYGKWLYGDLINLTNELKQICNHTQLEHAHSVDIKTIGQYTGLLDKNGKKIFEGDIVKDEQSGYEYVIKWFSEYACFALANKNGHMEYDVDEFEMLVNDLIVVGNIHDSSDFAEASE